MTDVIPGGKESISIAQLFGKESIGKRRGAFGGGASEREWVVAWDDEGMGKGATVPTSCPNAPIVRPRLFHFRLYDREFFGDSNSLLSQVALSGAAGAVRAIEKVCSAN